jgi:hypothetical protein
MLLSVLLYYTLIYTQAIDLYLADDFHLFKTVVWMQDAETVAEKWRLLFDQHNEHRIIFPRLLTLIDYWVEGHVNFRTLNIVASLVTLGTAGMLALEFRRYRLHALYFLPVVWILFQPQSYDNISYTISIVQLYGIVLLAFGVFMLLDRHRPTLALTVALIATFSHGNGMFTLAIGLLILLLQGRMRWALGWGAVMALALGVYFAGLEKGQSGDWVSSLTQPGRFLQGIGVFVGALAEVVAPQRYGVLALVGWVLIGAILITQGVPLWQYLRQGGLRRRVPRFAGSCFLLGSALFLGGTALIVSLFRSWMGLGGLVQPRYIHFSAVFVALTYVAVLRAFPPGAGRRGLLLSALVLSFAFNLSAYRTYTPLVFERRQNLIADAYNWRANQMTFGNHPSYDRNVREVYNRAIATGICRPSTFFFADLQQCLGTEACVDTNRTTPLTLGTLQPDLLGFTQPIVTVEGSQEGPGTPFLVLEREGTRYLVGTRPTWASWSEMLTEGRLTGARFSALFSTEPLATGTYLMQPIYVHSSGGVSRTGGAGVPVIVSRQASN